MTCPRLLDLYCGAGGAGMGYYRAGFDVTGVDNRQMPRYRFEFIQADALEYLRQHASEYDCIHASPPCQAHSIMRKGRWQDRDHPDLIPVTRDLLVASGKPYVIENVVGAPLLNPFMLCGTMFGLRTSCGSQLRRHRLFECPWIFDLLPPCSHNNGSAIGVYGGGQHPDRRRPATIGVYGSAGGASTRDGVAHFGTSDRRQAMGIDWMIGDELSQAIPPVYCEWIGERLIREVQR